MDVIALLKPEEEGYHGRNDLRPMPIGKKICVYVTVIILSPILLVLLAISLVCFWYRYVLCMTMNEHQLASFKVMCFDFVNKAPGKRFHVRSTGTASSDIIIPSDFVNDKGELHTCQGRSLRKSIECTVNEHLQQGPHGARIAADENREQPHYLLHGWAEPFDPSGDEVWTTHARTTTWAALYSWSVHIRPGPLCSRWSDAIDVTSAPDVFGYIYLMEVSNPEFYSGDSGSSRVLRVGGNTVNSPEHTPETEGKIFARYGYGGVKYMGNFPTDDPDAYIFKGGALKDAKLKILHTYRLLNPQSASGYDTCA